MLAGILRRDGTDRGNELSARGFCAHDVRIELLGQCPRFDGASPVDSLRVDLLDRTPAGVESVARGEVEKPGRERGHRRVDHEVDVLPSPDVARELIDHAMRLVREVDVVVLSDYAKGALNPQVTSAIIAAARVRRSGDRRSKGP